MAYFDCNGILICIVLLSCCSASSADIMVQEGNRLLLEEGTTLTMTCLTNTTADIDFFFNTTRIGTCLYNLGQCNLNDKYTLTASIGNQSTYILTSKTGVNTSFCGTYYCQDVSNTFQDSIKVSVTDVDKEPYDFLEEESRVYLRLSCVLDLTIDDLNVEWFTVDNNALTKLNLSLVEDVVNQFEWKNNCTACGGTEAQNISTGLTFKQTEQPLAYVYYEVHLSHPNFATTERTESPYPLKVIASVPDPSKKGPNAGLIGGIIAAIIVIIVFLLHLIACCCPERCPFILKCVNNFDAIIKYCFCWCCKQNFTIFWTINTNRNSKSSCIAGCEEPKHMCKIDELFWRSQLEINTCKKWNEASISERENMFLINNATIAQFWKDLDTRSKALNCFNNATDGNKAEINFLKCIKVDRRLANVSTDWLKLNASHQDGFLDSLGQCPKIMSLLWLHLKWRLKVNLFLHFWTSLNNHVQNVISEKIITSKIAKQEITGRIASVLKKMDSPLSVTDNTKCQDNSIETVEQLQSVLSKCGSDQRSKIFKDFHMVINMKEHNEKFDKLFQELPEDLKLKMMGETDKTRPVFVTSGFWRRWSEHEADIPLEEVCCVGQFISSCTENKSIIMCLENMDWKKIKDALTLSEIRNICLHVDWANIPIAIRQNWMHERQYTETTQGKMYRHLNTTSKSMKTRQGITLACKGVGTATGVTRIYLCFDDTASRSAEPSIAVTITSTTSEPLCGNNDFNNVIVKMLEMFELARYLRRIPGIEGSTYDAKQAILTVLREAVNVDGETGVTLENVSIDFI